MAINDRGRPSKARRALAEQRDIWGQWCQRLEDAQRELAELEVALDGDRLLAEPDLVDTLPAATQQARGKVEIAAAALDAQRVRVKAAELAVISEEADLAEAPLAKAQRALDEHERRTGQLLAELEKHEGGFVPAVDYWRLRRSEGYVDAPTSYPTPKSWALREAVEQARRPVLVLREIAAQRDPAPLMEEWGGDPASYYPACVWGPDAVVQAPAYRRQTQSREAELQWLRREGIPDQKSLLRDLERRIAAGAPRFKPTDLDMEALTEWRASATEILAEREDRAAQLAQQLEATSAAA